jgi:hypothetical protein
LATPPSETVGDWAHAAAAQQRAVMQMLNDFMGTPLEGMVREQTTLKRRERVKRL